MIDRKFLVTTLPKSGTNLVRSILEMMPPLARIRGLYFNNRLQWHPYNFVSFSSSETCLMGIGQPKTVRISAVRQQIRRIRPGTYGIGHVPYTQAFAQLLREERIQKIVMIRDPRSVVVSLMHYVLKQKRHYLHAPIRTMASDRDRLLALITGLDLPSGARHLGIAEQLDLMIPWVDDPDTLTLRFEHLIGSQGGGEDLIQQETINSLANFIGHPLEEGGAARIGKEMFGKGHTFRTGQIGEWSGNPNADLLEDLGERLGDRMGRLGYQSNSVSLPLPN